jgi:putative tryptophan/tyrosine transport system substrate-binding protein
MSRQVDRRAATIALAALPFAPGGRARAEVVRNARVAWISTEQRNADSPFFGSFRRALEAAGWTEGRNLQLDAWWSGGVGAPLQKTIEQALARQPHVVVAAGGLVVRPLMQTRVEAPIVFSYSGDPVIGGVVQSFARPGVNRTGVSLFSLDLVPKRIALMKELLPESRRVAIVGWPQHAGEPNERAAAISAAQRLGMDHLFVPVSTGDELDAAFARIRDERADSLLLFADGVTVTHAERIAALSRAHRLPGVSGWAVFAEKGNLMSYGPVLQATHARLAVYVDRILKGARASELPVELPSTQELVVNRRTASALGIVLPPAILARADRIID